MGILQYWKIIRQRLVLILLLTLVAVVGTGTLSFFVFDPEYQAKTTILVQSQAEGQKQVVYNDVLANQKLVKTYNEILKSRLIAEDVVKRLGLTLSSEQLLSKVSVSAASDSLVTTIVVTDQDAERAVNIANAYAQSFYENLNTIMKVDNVSVLDKAVLPANPAPVSPKPVMNMAIALVVGLLAGIGLSFLLEYIDNTVKDEKEIETLLGLPVLGVIATIGEDDKKLKKAKKSVMDGVAREV